ncbi:AMP-binding protein [Sedimenticola hydrogenitrophicus]|uniref:AMP-binding protein n=1 Tax=Sedimenticola hydrogenitrophicus TaxID=2967975 RepID=UPI0021A33E58|nr:AMP-binding protein [Sedimenticola hydrogenitrophicus]
MNTETASEDNLSASLLAVVEELVEELQLSRGRTLALSLDSSLDKDLGLDSLGRVELIVRIEQRFDIALPQSVFAEVETPRDLLRAISAARGRAEAVPVPEFTGHETKRIQGQPASARTLVEVLEWHLERHPERMHIRILGDEDEQDTVTYRQLWEGATRVAAALQQRGLQTGESVAIMLPTGREYFFGFFAVLMAGGIPVPIYPPARRSQLEDHLRRHSGILNNCQASMLITVSEARMIGQLLKSQVVSLRDITTVSDLLAQPGEYVRPVIGSSDIAFIQYTSGSTGSPKGVVLTHANLLANIRAMGEAVEADSNDVFVSWLPLYHDMGLIGAWLGSMYFAFSFIVMSPLTFLTRPQRWLWAMHHYRGTLSAAPNFGYELVLKRVPDEVLKGFDLSHWRCAFNGAEPVSPDTISRFTRRLSQAGFKAEAMMPVYGLAESSVGLAFPPLHTVPRIDYVQREAFTHTAHARQSDVSDSSALSFVTGGQPLPGHAIRIVDRDGKPLPERHEGALQFQGPSSTSGYYRNPEATQQLFRDEWLDTGDLAYLADGYLFVTGRSKDLIIRAGRNIYPQEVEEVVSNIEGVRKGCVVAFGTREPRTGTERLVLIAETRQQDERARQSIEKEITSVASDLIGLPPDEVILAPPHTVLKTSSGKVRRSACQEMYERGELEKRQAAVWLQVLRTAMRSLLPVWLRLKQAIVSYLYAAYAWVLFYALAAFGWVAVVTLPVMSWRWSVMRVMAKSLALLTGTRIKVEGLQNLPQPGMPCVYVANHASYLDGVLMVAAIPRRFRYAAKSELKKSLVSRLFLNRMGVEYVERIDKARGVIDAQRLVESLQRRESLFIFPEGTFQEIPGLLNFHMGAFLTAAEAKVPIIPIAIRGTRSILRGNSRFTRRGRIAVTIGEAIEPDELPEKETGDRWKTAIQLRALARKQILRYCGEPEVAKVEG